MHSSRGVRIGESDWTAELVCPPEPMGMVLFVHGRAGPAQASDLRIGGILHRHQLATLSFDAGDVDRDAPCSNPALLASKVEQALHWLTVRADLGRLPCGVFGSAAGACVALAAAALRPGRIQALVTSGAHIPLRAQPCLAAVAAPTLLIVVDGDARQVEGNRRVLRQLQCVKRLEVVPQAGGGADEPGVLASVAELAAWWFKTHLPLQRSH